VPYQVTQGGPGERLPVAVGTGIWALLFVLGLVLRPELQSNGREWWIWTALAGVLLGFVGYTYLVIRRPKRHPDEPREADRSTGDVDDVTRQSGEPTGLPKLRRRSPAADEVPPAPRPQGEQLTSSDEVQPKI
jgi:hypothetical protein